MASSEEPPRGIWHLPSPRPDIPLVRNLLNNYAKRQNMLKKGDAAPTGVDPADFRVTTFASGLNYPYGMQQLSDGSLLVADDVGDSVWRVSVQR